MNTSRRSFFVKSALLGGMAAVSPIALCSTGKKSSSVYPDYSALDAALQLPVLKRELFPSPVIIDKLELLQDRNNFICRVRSKDGAVGISIGHPNVSMTSYPMFLILQEVFIAKDARDLDLLIFNASERYIKRQGIPLCVQIATIEFAILDMLGNIANKSVGQLFGDIHNPEISIYLGTQIGPFREQEPEVSLELMKNDVLESKAKGY